MRVAYICTDPGVPVFGSKGCSRHCQEIIRAMIRRGYEVELFSTRPGGFRPPDLAHLPTHRIPLPKTSSVAEREMALVQAGHDVYRLLAGRGQFDMIYERYALWSSAAMEFAHDRGVTGILEVNAPLIDEQKTYRTLIHEDRARSIRSRAFGFASSLVAVSEQVAEKIRAEPAARSKVSVVPNGVDIQRFEEVAASRVYHLQEPLTIGFVGTLKPWHGVLNLLDSFAIAREENANLRLLVVGDGPEKEPLQQRRTTFSRPTAEAIEFTGAVETSEIPRILSLMDLGVAPYPKIEDFYFSPLKIVEYMAAGLPIVASRIGQIPEMIEHQKTGLLVTPGCRDALAGALLQLANSAEQRRRLGLAARRHAAAHGSWDMVLEKILLNVSRDRLKCEVG